MLSSEPVQREDKIRRFVYTSFTKNKSPLILTPTKKSMLFDKIVKYIANVWEVFNHNKKDKKMLFVDEIFHVFPVKKYIKLIDWILYHNIDRALKGVIDHGRTRQTISLDASKVANTYYDTV